MKKIILSLLCMGSIALQASDQQMLSPESIARLNKIKIFDIPGTNKKLFVDTEQLTRYVNLGWSAVLFNHKPAESGNTKTLFYAYSALTALLNVVSRGYGSALYVVGASYGPEFLRIAESEESCKSFLLRSLMTSQFVNGLFELDKIVANPLGLRAIWIR